MGEQMIRHTLALAIIATSADAEAVHTWGNSAARIEAAAPPAVARIIYSNGYGVSPRVVEDFVIDGVRVIINNAAGMKPDTFAVYPPEGFIAVPQSGVVEEHGQAVILIFSVEGAGA